MTVVLGGGLQPPIDLPAAHPAVEEEEPEVDEDSSDEEEESDDGDIGPSAFTGTEQPDISQMSILSVPREIKSPLLSSIAGPLPALGKGSSPLVSHVGLPGSPGLAGQWLGKIESPEVSQALSVVGEIESPTQSSTVVGPAMPAHPMPNFHSILAERRVTNGCFPFAKLTAVEFSALKLAGLVTQPWFNIDGDDDCEIRITNQNQLEEVVKILSEHLDKPKFWFSCAEKEDVIFAIYRAT